MHLQSRGGSCQFNVSSLAEVKYTRAPHHTAVHIRSKAVLFVPESTEANPGEVGSL